MSATPLFLVDAFADRPFEGNPAAVVPLEAPMAEASMQALARELGLSETAFFRVDEPEPTLRWFTPETEVDLCGHATLAAAHVLLRHLQPDRASVTFRSQSGPLTVTREARDATELAMEFPARPPTAIDVDLDAVATALGISRDAIQSVSASRDWVVRLADSDGVRAIVPDFGAIARLPTFGVCATAMGTGRDADVDFVSRYFAPREGVPEDPVTGSAHCSLAPLWAERLGRTTLRARQVSRRGGRVRCVVHAEGVRLIGRAVTVVEGRLAIAL
jgi:PhzF family phenazine biosynthesis protein